MSLAELAEQALELARTTLKGAEVEVKVDRNRLALARFANSFIHQNVAEDTTVVGLRVHVDGRTVALSTTLADLRPLVDRAAAAIAVAPRDPGWPGVAPARQLAHTSTIDEATKEASPADRAQVVHDFVAAAGGLVTAGYCRTVHWAGSYRNTAGQALDAEATGADLDGIARLQGADAVARLHSTRLSDIDGAALGARAARDVRSQSEPRELPPGRYEVILKPEAVADVLHNLAFYAFNGKYFNDGRCFAQLGTAQFDPAVTIFDDPFAGVGARPFDQDGSPRSRLVLVENGMTRAVAHDRRTAAEAGAESTGHALPGEPWGPQPVSVGFAPGSAGLDQMIAGTRRGILVGDLWYTRVLDPRTLVITGLTRNGAWLIEGGEITGPVRDFRFTQAYSGALAPGQVLGIGDTAVPQPTRKELHTLSCPALHLASWSFTGGASG